MDLNKKLEELKPYQLNCNVFDVYSYNGLTMQDLLCQFFTKINECITVSNETIDLAKWLVNEGLEIEVVKKLMMWLEDGTLENIINVTLFTNLNNKLNHMANNFYVIRQRKENELNDNEVIKEAILNSNEGATIRFNRDVVITEKIDISNRIIDGGNNTFYCGLYGLDYQFNATGFIKIVNCNVDSALIGRGFIIVSNSDMFIAENVKMTGYSKEFGYYKTDGGICLNSNIKKAYINNCSWYEWGNQYDTTTADLNRCITINDTVEDTNIENCSFISVNQAIVHAGNNLTVTNNKFQDVKDNGLYLFGENSFIQNNMFIDMKDEPIVIANGNYFISNNIFSNWSNKAIVFANNVNFVHVSNNTFISDYDNSQFIVTRDTSYFIKKVLVDNNIFQCDYPVENVNDWFRIGSSIEFKFTNNNVSVNHTNSSKKIITSSATIVHLFNNSFTSRQASPARVLDNNREGSSVLHADNYVSGCRIGLMGNKMGNAQSNVPYYTGTNDNKFVYCSSKPTWETGVMKKGDIIINTTIDTDSKNGDVMGWYFNGESLDIMAMPPQILTQSPVNIKRPRYIGDMCIDKTNSKIYIAPATGISSWVCINP